MRITRLGDELVMKCARVTCERERSQSCVGGLGGTGTSHLGLTCRRMGPEVTMSWGVLDFNN